MKQTAVEQLGIAFRQWQKEWENFNKTGKDKPVSFDEFIKPFLEMEKIRKYTEEDAKLIFEAGKEYWKTSGDSITVDELLEKINLNDTNKENREKTPFKAAVDNYKTFYEGKPLNENIPIDAFVIGAKWQQEQNDKNIESLLRITYEETMKAMVDWFINNKDKNPQEAESAIDYYVYPRLYEKGINFKK
jgi:hypothetical protein